MARAVVVIASIRFVVVRYSGFRHVSNVWNVGWMICGMIFGQIGRLGFDLTPGTLQDTTEKRKPNISHGEVHVYMYFARTHSILMQRASSGTSSSLLLSAFIEETSRPKCAL